LPKLSILDEVRLFVSNLGNMTFEIAQPRLRLGVTGLSRAGKTVFITSFIHNLIQGGKLPLFTPMRQCRITGAALQPQPDDAIPRFDIETHLKSLIEDRIWPQSTRQISQLRLTITYEPQSSFTRKLAVVFFILILLTILANGYWTYLCWIKAMNSFPKKRLI
jgi:predicted YcjX-like family ATPase